MSTFTHGCVRVADVELHFVEAGSGDPIVCVPGFTMDHRVFRGQLEGLADSNRVIAVDPRSHGLSTRTLRDNTYPRQGVDLALFLDALDLRRVTLCGWSFGGLATYACVKAGGFDRLRAVVIIDMTPKPLGSGTDGAWSDGTEQVYADDMAAEIVRDLPAFVRSGLDSMVSRPPGARDRELFEQMQLQTPPDAAISLLISAMCSDYTETAQTVDQTLPFANVVRDDWMQQAGPWLAQHAPHATVWTMPSHLGFWEEPAAFNAELRTFLASA